MVTRLLKMAFWKKFNKKKEKCDDWLYFFFLHLTGRELEGFDGVPDLDFPPCELGGI